MVTCTPWCGIGVRHIQYGLMAIMNCMDFWTLELQKSLYYTREKDLTLFAKDRGGGIRQEGRIAISLHQKKYFYVFIFLAYTSGRFLSTFIVPRVNNKYMLFTLTVSENLFGGTIIWFYNIVGLNGIAGFLASNAFCRAMHAPLMYNIMAKWMPPYEYTTTFCLITIVKDMFSVILSHLVLKMGDLELVLSFMLITFVYLGWCALWLIFGAESPQTSFLISKQEWNHLSKSVGPRKKIFCKAKSPWKSIFSVGLLYVIIFFDFGKESCSTIIHNGVKVIAGGAEVSGATLICLQAALMVYCLGFLTSCVLIDKAISKQKIEVGAVRKMMTTIGCCGVAITMILTAYVDAKVAKIFYLFLANCFFIIVSTAEPTIFFDLSPNYASSTYSLVSSARQILIALNMQILSPKLKFFDETLKGANITRHHIGPSVLDGSVYRFGFAIFFTNIFFLISGNIELKDYDSFDTHDWRRESISSYP